MSRRKFRAPRHGSKSFMCHKRTKRARGHISCHPKNVESETTEHQPLHLTSFIAYKAGCTHVVRDVVKPKSPLDKREISEMATILETPAMVCAGYVVYRETPAGIRSVKTVHADNLSDAYIRAVEPKLTRHAKLPRAFSAVRGTDQIVTEQKEETEQYKEENCDIVRMILHTIPPACLERKKAHVIESQVNGGKDMKERIEFAHNLLGKPVGINSFLVAGESVDIAAVTKGKGFQGVIKRFGVKELTQSSRKGHRRVACIGPWHPSNVSFAVARAGQMGKNHRTEVNKHVLLVGKGANEVNEGNASTLFDPTRKNITPMGGFKRYGQVNSDFIMIKGSVSGPNKGAVALRKSLRDPYKRALTQEARIKFIDTASKIGKGKFQTKKEKNEYFGIVNKEEQ